MSDELVFPQAGVIPESVWKVKIPDEAAGKILKEGFEKRFVSLWQKRQAYDELAITRDEVDQNIPLGETFKIAPLFDSATFKLDGIDQSPQNSFD